MEIANFPAGRLFFVINPRANNGRALQYWAAVRSELDSRGMSYRAAFSRDGDDVERLARQAVCEGSALVAGVGGDGTLSRVAGALAGTKTVLGVLPAGTGNDFARSLKIPPEPSAACAGLLHGEDQAIDIGRYNGRIFLNVTGAGLDAAVVAEANRLKRIFGSLSYLAALVSQLLFYRPCTLKITMDERQVITMAWLVSVANGRYYGGGMEIAPQADCGDGLADVIVVGQMHRLKFLTAFPAVYRGKHLSLPQVHFYRAGKVCVESDRPLPVHTDGDLTGSLPFCITMERQALRVRVPPRDK
jgi:YegS/Rv2252/BmrU family lipid kinase